MVLSILKPVMAIVPAWLICYYAYRKDRAEKEPLWLLLVLFLLGAVCYFPAFCIGKEISSVFFNAFSDRISISADGMIKYSDGNTEFIHQILVSFVSVAFVEEIIKWIALLAATGHSKNFNSLFDGIIYSVVLSMGFLAAKSFHIFIKTDWLTILNRSAELLPVYLSISVVSGLFYTLWHSFKSAGIKEKALAAKKMIDNAKIKSPWWLLSLSLIMPVILHGFHSYVESRFTILFYLLAPLFCILFFVIVHAVSTKDERDSLISDQIISKAHPEYAGIKEGENDE